MLVPVTERPPHPQPEPEGIVQSVRKEQPCGKIDAAFGGGSVGSAVGTGWGSRKPLRPDSNPGFATHAKFHCRPLAPQLRAASNRQQEDEEEGWMEMEAMQHGRVLRRKEMESRTNKAFRLRVRNALLGTMFNTNHGVAIAEAIRLGWHRPFLQPRCWQRHSPNCHRPLPRSHHRSGRQWRQRCGRWIQIPGG
ncbi:MAG: hypothetical protein UZ07_CHB004000110 [Chlorobi bacterium OLB7]|nr:MAG: hypothetical protein UZ07_CHB004000110 [Chlorobi bacterium OLB7]